MAIKKVFTYYFRIVKTLGLKVVLFRLWLMFQKKIGLFLLRFPTRFKVKQFIEIDVFRESNFHYLPEREKLNFEIENINILKQKIEKTLKHEFTYFSGISYKLGDNLDWIKNPTNGYRYELNHFSKIQDLSKKNGDIKYVWELSRFCWIYDIVRYDHYFKTDNGNFVIDKIIDWIEKNPLNLGPNYKCSQEISIRVINWTFALNFYKNSPYLNQEKLNKILTSMFYQGKHVYSNINFSKIAVRNNHAITETLGLYFIGSLFPFFNFSKKYKKKGKKWLEKEIEFQIFDDGSYIQHSMNYHRMVIQLLSLAFKISAYNKEKFPSTIIRKSKSTLKFLYDHVDEISGNTPNYGSNDGTLIFPLSNLEYANYKGQLNALSQIINNQVLFNEIDTFEDIYWFGELPVRKNYEESKPQILRYDKNGYYLFKTNSILIFIRCADIQSKSGNNDNLHIDIWKDGINIIRDSGTFGYNAEKKILDFFRGTISHNTIVIEGKDQIERGPRFVSLGSSKRLGKVKIDYSNEEFSLRGSINAFNHLGKNISHERDVYFNTNELKLTVIDKISNHRNKSMSQIWNLNNNYLEKSKFHVIDEMGDKIEPKIVDGYFSPTYGVKEDSHQIHFQSNTSLIKAEINL